MKQKTIGRTAKPQTCYAVVAPDGLVFVFTVRERRQETVKAFTYLGYSWSDARREGYRVARCVISEYVR